MRILDVQDLVKAYGQTPVLTGLSFGVDRGTVHALLGPNGAGKTTTINILCHLLEADAGHIRFQGEPVTPHTKNRIGVVPQEISLYSDLTPLENLEFFGRVYGMRRPQARSRANELIRRFNLEAYQGTVISKLSGGWQRRVNIAVGLVHAPSLLVLDEPTAGLDVEARYELWELIKMLKNADVTVLLTTHQLDEAEHLSDHISIIQGGKTAADGSLPELRRLVPAHTLALIASTDDAAVREKATRMGWDSREYGGKLALLLPEPLTLKEIVAKFDELPLRSVSLQPVRLEHVYLEVMASEK